MALLHAGNIPASLPARIQASHSNLQGYEGSKKATLQGEMKTDLNMQPIKAAPRSTQTLLEQTTCTGPIQPKPLREAQPQGREGVAHRHCQQQSWALRKKPSSLGHFETRMRFFY